jgi:hypothetical protein
MRKIAAVVGVVAVLLTTMMAVAMAQPDDGVSACYHARTGDLRVDVDGSGCRPSELPVTLGEGLVTRRVVASEIISPDTFEGVSALCDPGEVVLGGGHQQASINPEVVVVTDAPYLDGDRQGWLVAITNPSEIYDFELWAYAICAPGVSSEF